MTMANLKQLQLGLELAYDSNGGFYPEKLSGAVTALSQGFTDASSTMSLDGYTYTLGSDAKSYTLCAAKPTAASSELPEQCVSSESDSTTPTP